MLEDFFKPNELNKRQNYPNIPGREFGDDLIHKTMASEDIPQVKFFIFLCFSIQGIQIKLIIEVQKLK